MKQKLQKGYLILMIMILIAILVRISSNIIWFSSFVLGLVGIIFSLFFKKKIKFIIFGISSYFVILSLIASYGVVGFIGAIGGFLLFFNTNQGNEFFWLNETLLLPIQTKQEYYGVALKIGQVEQRSLIYKQNILNQLEKKSAYEWQDINIVALGGDSIIDLGATILPEGESVIVVRKLYGRVRLIVPQDLGLKLNISLVKGFVYYEQDKYELLNDLFIWQSPDYRKSTRRIKVIISSVLGNIEVIRL